MYSVSSTSLCYENDVLPFQIEDINTSVVDEEFTTVLGPFCSYKNLDLTVTVVEQGTSTLPEDFIFETDTLVLKGRLSKGDAITI